MHPVNPACPVGPADRTGACPVGPGDRTGACPVGPADRTGVNPVKSLAEKTIENVLLHFGDSVKVARRRYTKFVKKGIKQGRRTELQGEGLVRPACHAREGHLLSEIGVTATESGKAKRDV